MIVKSQPLISIVTVYFNSEKTIEQTIVSVLQQKLRDFKNILINGKSTDRTLDLIQKYAALSERIKWVSERDNGIYDAKNKGTLMAEGKFSHYLNKVTCKVLDLKKYFEGGCWLEKFLFANQDRPFLRQFNLGCYLVFRNEKNQNNE